MCCGHISPLLQQPHAFRGVPRSQMRSECTAGARERKVHDFKAPLGQDHEALLLSHVDTLFCFERVYTSPYPGGPPPASRLALLLPHLLCHCASVPRRLAPHPPSLSPPPPSTPLPCFFSLLFFVFADDAQTRMSATKRTDRKGAGEKEGPAPRSGGDGRWERASAALVFSLM